MFDNMAPVQSCGCWNNGLLLYCTKSSSGQITSDIYVSI